MMYNRTFHISAAHFNGALTYAKLYAALDAGSIDIETALDIMRETHGHNFKIVIEINAPLDGPYVVDDEKLEAIVKQWDAVNLSVHPDFLKTRERATTELMAAKLFAEIAHMGFDDVCVAVHETSDIYAVEY